VKIAQKQKVIVKHTEYVKYVEPTREIGINYADSEWVFIIDADERITNELAFEIKKVINENKFSYFYIPRKNLFEGIKWLKHGGWWPDYQIRLIKKDCFVKWPKEIHSAPIINGSYSKLKNPILHAFHGDFEKMVKKTLIFEDIESELLLKADKKVYIFTFFRKFYGELFRRLIKNLGFLDGSIGIIESIYQAFSKTITYLLLYEKKNYRALRSLP